MIYLYGVEKITRELQNGLSVVILRGLQIWIRIKFFLLVLMGQQVQLVNQYLQELLEYPALVLLFLRQQNHL